MTHTDSTDRSTVVDREYHWQPVDQDTPIGRKLQLIHRDAGVATYGRLTPSNRQWWTHWAPLPTFKKD